MQRMRGPTTSPTHTQHHQSDVSASRGRLDSRTGVRLWGVGVLTWRRCRCVQWASFATKDRKGLSVYAREHRDTYPVSLQHGGVQYSSHSHREGVEEG